MSLVLTLLSALGCGFGGDDEFRQDCYFDVEPTGKSVVFAGSGAGGSDLWTMSLTSHEPIRIARTIWRESFPAIAHDGSIYYSAYGPSWKLEKLRVRHPGGSDAPVISDNSWQRAAVPIKGDSLAVVSYSEVIKYGLASHMPNEFNLEIYAANGLRKRVLLSDFGDLMLFPGCECQRGIVVCGSKKLMDRPLCWIVPLDGGRPQQIHTQETVWSASASPDGKTIVYVGTEPEPSVDSDIYLMALDGTSRRRLTHLRQRIVQARFEPNGKSILFVVGRNFSYDLYRVDLQGTVTHLAALVS